MKQKQKWNTTRLTEAAVVLPLCDSLFRLRRLAVQPHLDACHRLHAQHLPVYRVPRVWEGGGYMRLQNVQRLLYVPCRPLFTHANISKICTSNCLSHCLPATY